MRRRYRRVDPPKRIQRGGPEGKGAFLPMPWPKLDPRDSLGV